VPVFDPQLLSVSTSWLSLSTSLGLSFFGLVSQLSVSASPGQPSFLYLFGRSLCFWFLLVSLGLLVWSPHPSVGPLVSGLSRVGLSWFLVSLILVFLGFRSLSLGLVFTNRKVHKRLSIIFFFIVFHTCCILKIVFVRLYVIGYATFFGFHFEVYCFWRRIRLCTFLKNAKNWFAPVYTSICFFLVMFFF
jgi:hypothetical protein